MSVQPIIEYPSLETDRLQLNILDLHHTEEVFAHFADEEVVKFMDIEPCKDLQEAEEIIRYHLEDAGCRWGLFDKSAGKLIGTCGFHYLRKSEDGFVAEIGFDLAKRYWGKGIMSEAMKAVVAFGFADMGLNTIDATVEPDNERSIALLKKLGFERDSELRDGLVYFYLRAK
ncbi:GNAT family N-acetyltransferase [Paenibacillus thermotolerans]|uniref:GNAT family N-acetyltransferase n=1 Tax=Paenibacillus thermotolerans TaxID=3027807 RepID=UPI002368711E|nr:MULTISPECIES: GNAT family N-acetyltransferase [unclassified Paenibacillus]